MAEGRNLNSSGLKTGQRLDVPESLNFNVATFGPTLRRDREACFSTSRRWDPTSRRDRKVEFQRCDVEVHHCDVIERCIFNVVTLKSNVVTCPRG